MMRGTTPKHTFNIPFDVSIIKELRVVYLQGKVCVVKKNEDCILEGETITVNLSQQDTFKFDSKPTEIQIRIKTNDGQVFGSSIKNIDVGRCLDDEVL